LTVARPRHWSAVQEEEEVVVVRGQISWAFERIGVLNGMQMWEVEEL